MKRINELAVVTAAEDIAHAWETRFKDFDEQDLASHITSLSAILDGEMDYCEFAESENLGRKPTVRLN